MRAVTVPILQPTEPRARADYFILLLLVNYSTIYIHIYRADFLNSFFEFFRKRKFPFIFKEQMFFVLFQ